jgi:hypothetical protein
LFGLFESGVLGFAGVLHCVEEFLAHVKKVLDVFFFHFQFDSVVVLVDALAHLLTVLDCLWDGKLLWLLAL